MTIASTVRDILILAGLILLNAFFALSEMSLVSSRKARLKAKADEGKKGYKAALRVSEEPAPYLSTIQIGMTLIGTLSGAFGGATLAGGLSSLIAAVPALAPYAESLGLATVVILITFFSIVIGELVPKRIGLRYPEPIASAVVRVILGIGRVFRPIERFLSATSGLVIRLLGIKAPPEDEVTGEDIRVMIEEGRGSGTVGERESDMMEGVFHLGERRVDAFATNRSDVEWLDLEAGVEEVRDFLRSHPEIQAVPVCRGSLDKPEGIVRVRDLLSSLLDGSYRGLKAAMAKPVYVPGSMNAVKAFEAFRQSGEQIVLVLDEYGGVEGVLTLRDLVEEIVGELSSKGQVEQPAIVERADGSALVDGQIPLDDFRERYGLSSELPESREYHTLAGFLLALTGTIPRTGDVAEWRGFRFEIVDMDANRIDKVLVTPPPPEPEGEEDFTP